MTKNKAPIEQVQKRFNRALHAASITAAYRHPKLSAVKHVEQTDSIDGIRSDASPEELRAEIAKRVALLRDRGYMDLDALPPPEPAASSLISGNHINGDVRKGPNTATATQCVGAKWCRK